LLHVVWALLIWFNSNALPEKWRRSLKLFVVLTLWAVMGLEDTHWMMDVVVAVPLAVAIQTAVITRRVITARRCWTRVAICAAITAMWIIGFTRMPTLLFSLPRTAAWIAVLFTVWWPLSQQRAEWLDRREAAATRSASASVKRAQRQVM